MAQDREVGTLAELSAQLAAAVERAASSIVSIHARRRIPSSGVVWRDDIVVSASHTVRRDGDVPVVLPGGERVTARVVGRDAGTDLVAMRLSTTAAAAAPRATTADARVGALVLAVGRPGRDVSASFGIVSAVTRGWRTEQGRRLDGLLRLDVAVYDGFSGGPLVDASGAVLGIDNSALARGGAMALPARIVDEVVDELLQRGHVRRPFIGVAVHPVALGAAAVQRHGLGGDAGLVVLSIADGSPAERAGLLLGDVLVAADGRALGGPVDLLDALASSREGQPVELTYLRAGEVRRASIVPVDREAGGGKGS